MTTIKITELTDIGANLASSTVLPVVNMSGTPTTQKTVLGNIANVILGNAGGNYVAVGAATLAGTVTTNAQPNITSTGSLTGLTVSNAAGTVNFSNTANVTLGAVGNLHIAGGTAGQLLSTNGNGTLSWASDTTTYGNSNVVSLMASFGSNTITTTGNVSVGNIIGNGRALTNIAGANVSGFVPNANVANTAFAVAAANVTGLGNIATISLTGSNSNVLYGNGVFAAVAGGANIGNVTFNDINIIGTGNLHLQPDSASAASYLDIFLTSGPDLHLVASNGANLILGEDNGPNVMTSWNGNAYVQSWDSNTNTQGGVWTFGGDGNLTLPNDANIATIGNVTQFNTCTNGFLSLNSYDAGGNNIASLAVNSIDGLVGISTHDTATDSDYQWGFNITGGTIFPTLTVDLHNGGNQTAQTLQFGDPTQQSIITGPTPEANVNAQRIIIQGQRGNGTGEGGDVYVWGGDSDVNGGDIKIYAGDAEVSGYGGYINIDGGTGIDGGGGLSLTGGQSADGQGGEITITPGYSGNANGATLSLNGGQAAGNGGGVNITAGAGTANGGQVTITGGQSALGLSGYGNVVVSAGASQWKFDNTGNLTLPANTFAVNYANGTQVSIGGGGGAAGNAGDVQINVAGNIGADSTLRYVDNGGEMTLYADYLNAPGIFTSDIYAGDGTPSNITLTTNIGNATWTFDTTGNLNTAGDIVGPAGANLTIYANAGVHEFTFADDGTFYAPDNVVLGGNAIYIGPGANTLAGTEHAVLIASSNHFAYIQGVINNVSDNGSADWVAQGAKGDDTGGWADMGFTSSGFGDANYTITGPGDGYLIVESYAPGQTLLGGGGNLVLATGDQGTVNDIIFGTGGFLSSNIFGRISHANNSLELSRTGATITFPDATEQTTAYINPSVTGNWTLATGNNTVNISVPLNGTYSIWVRGNIPNGIVTYTATAVVTNTNVPVVGSSYAWYYAAGNALVFTAIPNQFVGTVNNISNAVVSTTTANVFTFGITNNSGNTAVVNWGYTKL